MTGLLRIGAVVARTGLSSHVIRVWERRYGAVKPHRSSGGTRLYDADHVDRLQLLARLTEKGYAISTIASMTDDDLRALVGDRAAVSATASTEHRMTAIPATVADGASRHEADVLAFLDAVAVFDLERATEQLHEVMLAMPAARFVDEVVVPALVRAGSAWERGDWSIAQEHAASSVMRNVLGNLVRRQRPFHAAPTAVVTTPGGELHEFGALMAALRIAVAAWHTVYLGPNLPVADIVQAVESSGAKLLALSVVMPPSPLVLRSLVDVRGRLDPAVTIAVGGRSASAITGVDGLRIVAGLHDFDRLLVELATSATETR